MPGSRRDRTRLGTGSEVVRLDQSSDAVAGFDNERFCGDNRLASWHEQSGSQRTVELQESVSIHLGHNSTAGACASEDAEHALTIAGALSEEAGKGRVSRQKPRPRGTFQKNRVDGV